MRFRPMTARRVLIAAGAAGWVFAISSAASWAQGLDCSQLQAEIAAVRGNPGVAQRYAAAARRQAQQIARTVDYARSIGCDNRQFLFFGSPPPAQCPAISARVRRMQANLQRLQEQAARAGGAMERRALQSRYDSYCRGGERAALQRPRSFFQQLFGGGDESPPSQAIPINPRSGGGETNPASTIARAGAKAVCVRTTDGGFFPVSYTATRAKLASLQQQCQALCPNVPTELFTMPEDGVIEQAVSVDGKPYSSLSVAGLFQKKYDPAALCRPPGQSWAQALEGAAKLNAPQASDIVVTARKSTEMAAVTRANQAADSKSAIPDQPPDAGSADIGGTTTIGKFYGLHSGATKEEAGADGVKRPVRIVGPKT